MLVGELEEQSKSFQQLAAQQLLKPHNVFVLMEVFSPELLLVPSESW